MKKESRRVSVWKGVLINNITRVYLGPTMLIAIIFSQRDSSTIPALLTQMSTDLNFDTAASNATGITHTQVTGHIFSNSSARNIL